jgi:hypothetical protein
VSFQTATDSREAQVEPDTSADLCLNFRIKSLEISNAIQNNAYSADIALLICEE